MICRLASRLAGIAVAVAVGAAQPAPTLSRHEASRMSMACLYSIEAYAQNGANLPRIVEEALDEVDRIDRLMSHYKPDSPLSRVNREAASTPVAVDGELFDFIADAIDDTRRSNGAFDITVGPLMQAWGFFHGEGRLPGDGELRAARERVGAQHVKLSRADRTIAFDRPGVALDLGGIAKGYAVDRAVALLRDRKVTAALVNGCGSSIYGLGAPPGKTAWKMAVQDPLASNKTALTVDLKNRALSIAGRSEKSFEAGGVVYSHIMDPRSGKPVQGMLTVAVASETATNGDALDDVFFVLGEKGSRSILTSSPGVDVWFFVPSASGWSVEHRNSGSI